MGKLVVLSQLKLDVPVHSQLISPCFGFKSALDILLNQAGWALSSRSHPPMAAEPMILERWRSATVYLDIFNVAGVDSILDGGELIQTNSAEAKIGLIVTSAVDCPGVPSRSAQARNRQISTAWPLWRCWGVTSLTPLWLYRLWYQ